MTRTSTASTSLVDPLSLAMTLDNVNACLFHNTPIPIAQRLEAARWVAERLGGPRAYRGLYAPTTADLARGFRVFTGEVFTHASARHIAGEEAARTLILLDAPDPAVRETLDRVAVIIDAFARVIPTQKLPQPDARGWYCCGKCTVAYWRYLRVSTLADADDLLTQGIQQLKAHRLGNGTWRRFPFWYTLLALLEIDSPEALDELRYAASASERTLRRPPRNDPYARRRYAIAERALARV